MIAVFLSLFAVAFITGCGDSLPPTTPTGLTVTAQTSTSILLSWEPSDDYGGVEGYRIFRNGSKYARTGETSFLDSGLTNSTTYCYQVDAYDEEGNHSDKTPEECATTPASGVAVLPPTNLIVNAVSASQIDLSWDASASPDVNYYEIWRDSSFLDTATALTYSDAGLTNNTSYCYYLLTVNLTGSKSSRSTELCDTTDP